MDASPALSACLLGPEHDLLAFAGTWARVPEAWACLAAVLAGLAGAAAALGRLGRGAPVPVAALVVPPGLPLAVAALLAPGLFLRSFEAESLSLLGENEATRAAAALLVPGALLAAAAAVSCALYLALALAIAWVPATHSGKGTLATWVLAAAAAVPPAWAVATTGPGSTALAAGTFVAAALAFARLLSASGPGGARAGRGLAAAACVGLASTAFLWVRAGDLAVRIALPESCGPADGWTRAQGLVAETPPSRALAEAPWAPTAATLLLFACAAIVRARAARAARPVVAAGLASALVLGAGTFGLEGVGQAIDEVLPLPRPPLAAAPALGMNPRAWAEALVPPRARAALGRPRRTHGTASRALPPMGSDLVAALERTACYGTCPVYRVEVYADGRVRWHGSDWVARHGEAFGWVDAGTLETLRQAFRGARFTALRGDFARAEVTDCAYITTTLATEQGRRSIRRYACNVTTQDELALEALEDDFDRIVGTDRWVGAEADWP